MSTHDNNTHIAPMTEYIPATKAYKDSKFLNSKHARNIRILCEHEETQSRLEYNNLKATILVFGSARSKSHAEYKRIKDDLEKEIKKDPSNEAAASNLVRLEQGSWMCEVRYTLMHTYPHILTHTHEYSYICSYIIMTYTHTYSYILIHAHTCSYMLIHAHACSYILIHTNTY